MSKARGGEAGVKGILNNVKKTCVFGIRGIPYFSQLKVKISLTVIQILTPISTPILTPIQFSLFTSILSLIVTPISAPILTEVKQSITTEH